MRLEFHQLARSDVSRIMDYYEDAGGQELADEFYTELWSYIDKAVAAPEAYAIRERDIRRVNLDRFPFHFLYRVVENRIRILAVRHHRRRPSLGIRRR
jgi:plasmid stabilization system protein ParE